MSIAKNRNLFKVKIFKNLKLHSQKILLEEQYKKVIIDKANKRLKRVYKHQLLKKIINLYLK